MVRTHPPLVDNLTTEEKRALRESQAQVSERVITSMYNLNAIRIRTGQDSKSEIEYLKSSEVFTEIPEQFVDQRKSAVQAKAPSQTREEMRNASYNAEVALRSKRQTPSEKLQVVLVSDRVLAPTWDMARDNVMAAHSAQTESTLAPLFSKSGKAQVGENGEAVDDLPSFCHPPEDNPRKQVQQRKAERDRCLCKKQNEDSDVPQSATPQLKGKRVSKTFVPRCAEEGVVKGTRRQEVEEQKARRTPMGVSPFRI